MGYGTRHHVMPLCLVSKVCIIIIGENTMITPRELLESYLQSNVPPIPKRKDVQKLMAGTPISAQVTVLQSILLDSFYIPLALNETAKKLGKSVEDITTEDLPESFIAVVEKANEVYEKKATPLRKLTKEELIQNYLITLDSLNFIIDLLDNLP